MLYKYYRSPMSLHALNGSSEIQRFECSGVIKIVDGIILLSTLMRWPHNYTASANAATACTSNAPHT